jgi:hypothetical protein
MHDRVTTAPPGWRLQISSAADRDGLELELWTPTNKHAAAVFRDQSRHTVHIERYGVEIPNAVWAWFTTKAVTFVASFNDAATPLNPAAWTGYGPLPADVPIWCAGE